MLLQSTKRFDELCANIPKYFKIKKFKSGEGLGCLNPVCIIGLEMYIFN